MKKYHAYIKGHELLTDDYYKTQWTVINRGWTDIRGKSLEHIGLHEPDDFQPLTKEEWANLGINEDNADFKPVEELEE